MAAIRDLFAMTKDDLNKETKKDIIRMVLAAKDAHVKSNASGNNNVQAALSALTECTQSLQKEIGELKENMESFHKILPSDANHATIAHPDPNPEVMRKALQSVLVGEKLKSEMVISNVEEDGKDAEFISRLCNQIDFKVVPNGCVRLGEKTNSRRRPLKVTFQTEFDARAFRSRCEQNRRASDDFPNIRIWSCRTPTEQKKFAQSLEIAKDLNKAAQDNDAEYSFSVRENAEIWKFEKTNGEWRQNKDWEPPMKDMGRKSRNNSGND
jgi:hypothetical protein